jgi:hypothetical protein
LAVCAALAGLAAAAVFSIRAGWADYCMRQETIESTRRAIALLPDQPEYHARLAFLLAGTDPPAAADALRRAVALNPLDARSWIELGLGAESEGDRATALACLLRAAQADHAFLPRWTLANYYFRRDDLPMFWFWARRAAGMVSGDALPMFRLCGQVAEDGNLIDRLQIRDPAVRAAYLSYLLDQNRVDLIAPAVQRLLRQNRQEDVPLLLTACERLLETHRVDQAVETWNRLAAARRVPFPTAGGDGGQLVANGSFAAPPESRGFDWRLPVVEGVSVSRDEEPRGLRVTFSGRQPEDCEALAQLVPVRGKMPYELSFRYRTAGIAGGAGLAWRIADAGTGAVLTPLKDPPGFASEPEAEGRLAFHTPVECRLLRLSLRYRRSPGTTRIEGFLVLRDVALKPLAQPPIDGSRVR